VDLSPGGKWHPPPTLRLYIEYGDKSNRRVVRKITFRIADLADDWITRILITDLPDTADFTDFARGNFTAGAGKGYCRIGVKLK